MNSFDKIYTKIITEHISENGFYTAKRKDGTPVIGVICNGDTRYWKVGPTMNKSTIDKITGKPLGWMTPMLWLPNANDYRKGIAIGVQTYQNAIELNNEEQIKKILDLGLPLDIDFELA